MSVVSFQKVDKFKKLANEVFEEQKKRILKLLPFVEVHHIGSTAIPNSVTKGDLDVNIRVERNSFQQTVDELKKLYDINQPENWTEDFASFKDKKNLAMDFGLQLTVIGTLVDDFVTLRDLLINDAKLVEEYNKMKLPHDGKDMDAYRKEKANFFQRLREDNLKST